MGKKPIARVRKPPSLPAVSGHAGDGDSSARRGDVTRRDGRQLRRLTVLVRQETARRFQVRCAELDRRMSDVAEELLQAWLTQPD